jgi:carbon monoxide dehydrogenase subunit G
MKMGSTNQEIEINAPVDTVWQAIRDFHNMGWAPNVITNLETVGDKPGDAPGAGRILNGAFHETLQTLDDDGKTFTYSIDDGPSPVSKDDVNNYIGRVAVEGAGEGTRVEWTSNWENNDEAAQDFCSGIYNALLNDMKASLE